MSWALLELGQASLGRPLSALSTSIPPGDPDALVLRPLPRGQGGKCLQVEAF